jgi:hypothetical protein
MSQIAQIRINKSTEVEEIINFLKTQYVLLDDSELVKLALFELYKNKISNLSLNHPSHPYYNKLSSEEELGVAISKNELKEKNNITTLKSPQDISKFMKSLKA